MPNILIQLTEALGVGGWVVVLLFLCGGSVWVVMAVRRNRDDHDRLDGKIDNGLAHLAAAIETSRKESRDEMQAWRKESQEDRKESQKEMQAWRKESRDEMQAWRKESREDSKETRAMIKGLEKETGAKIEGLRKESREDSKETRAELSSINSRLDHLIDRKPPDSPG